MKAKKRFGQHFLENEDIAKAIAMAADAPTGSILEIGPGQGVMTKYLLERDVELKVVELDNDLIPVLRETFPELEIIHEDFLKVDRVLMLGEKPFTIIGNFPYNISTQILFKLLDWKDHVPELVGMFQKEVAKRVASPPGSKVYGVTSVLIQAYYDVEYLFSVGNGNFSPPPKVQSGVIRLVRKANYELPADPVVFKRIVKQSFGQRRKMLRNTLKPDLPADILADELFRKRPEELGVDEFVRITNIITEFNKKQRK